MDKKEILNGEVYIVSQGNNTAHNTIMSNILNIFDKYFKDTNYKVASSMSISLTDKDIVIPDISIINEKESHTVPDLIVEIITPDTHKNDRGYKKDLYEKSEIKEYWIIAPGELSVEVYILKEGKYHLDEVYIIYPDYELVKLSEEEKLKIPKQIKSNLFNDLKISIEEVFRDTIKER